MTITRRAALAGATTAGAALAMAPLAASHAQKPVTVRWWYHFDDPMRATRDFDEIVSRKNAHHAPPARDQTGLAEPGRARRQGKLARGALPGHVGRARDRRT